MENPARKSFRDFDYIVKVVLIGDAAVGKSSLLSKYVDEEFETAYNCTIGVDFKIKSLIIDNKKVKLQVWDTAGQERFKPITNCYFRSSNGCVAVYDICNRESFDNVKIWINDYRENNSIESIENVLLVGNKIDKAEGREVSYDEGKKYAESSKCEFLEASAKSGEGVNELFEAVSKMIIVKMSLAESLHSRDLVDRTLKGKSLITETPKKKKGCCH
ncbi:unnamed protein product [Blepharisma stoltei]|uniref:Uncharacterized protein n=1 Tax=Blepharisma stoltei TaxID=1481888 RepID=A0AAU9KAA8_9CILI|nr:unnamed protein product [Blepharisma stoltei]